MVMASLLPLSVLAVLVIACSCRYVGMSHIDDRLIVQTDNSLPSDLDQLYSYCTKPNAVNGSEGLVSQWYSLQQIHVILTPGFTDISSKVKVQGLIFPSMSCDISSQDKAKKSLHKFRMGSDKYKLVNHNGHFNQFHPTFPVNCTQNHLASQGFQQMISIGRHLDNSYLSHQTHKKLNGQYSSVHVSSIPSQTSYQSLLGFLHGFLSEKQLYKTKIHESRGDFCEFNELNLTTCNCAKIREMSPFAFKSVEKGSFLFKDSFPYKNQLAELMQIDKMNETSAVEIFQLLMQYKCNGLSQSLCHVYGLCHLMNDYNITELHKILAKSHLSLYTDSNFRKHSELRVYPFLEQLMLKAEKPNPQQTVNIYMGDKHFMQYLMSTLDVFKQQVMPMASRLIFEVFKKNGGQLNAGDLYIRVLYNGEDVTHKMSVCSRSMENGLCKLDRFKLLVTALRKQYTENCSVSQHAVNM